MSASRCRRRQILKDTDRHPKLFLKLTTFHNNGARLKFPRSWTVRQKMKDWLIHSILWHHPSLIQPKNLYPISNGSIPLIQSFSLLPLLRSIRAKSNSVAVPPKRLASTQINLSVGHQDRYRTRRPSSRSPSWCWRWVGDGWRKRQRWSKRWSWSSCCCGAPYWGALTIWTKLPLQ